MCGICGIVEYNNNANFNKDILYEMCQAMKYRGPDDEGIYINLESMPKIGFGHRRLKIIDLSWAGHQPMCNEDGKIWITFNGEIYNFKELRFELENKGHSFRSHSDTETIIHLYEEYGSDCVKYLRGMFAFSIWDSRNNSLLLTRDRVGKKPLLYYHNDGIFCFASEFLSLFESHLVKKEINYDALDYYLTFGYIPAPFTVYKDVFKLLPAHRLTLKDAKVNIEQYWQLNYSEKINISEDEAIEEVSRLLKEAVKIRLYSDVPLGAFLSGGIDSSIIVGLMAQLSSRKVMTFSIGFEESDYNELKYARNIARKFNTEHNELIVRPNALEIIPLLVEHYGEPFADSSCIPTYYVAQQTKQYVTVALNGDGGDELFAGYERYQAMKFSQMLPSPFRYMLSYLRFITPQLRNQKNSLARIKRFLDAVALPLEQRYVKWVGIFDEPTKRQVYSKNFLQILTQHNSFNFIKPFFKEFNGKFNLDSFLQVDTASYLPNDLLVKIDIASMANSLEARSPFLDHKLMEFVAKLPPEYKMKNFLKKYILKKAFRNFLPIINLQRKKMGFGVPLGKWLRNEMRNYLEDNLLSSKCLGRGYYNPSTIKNLVEAHINGQSDYSHQLWALLMLELWHQRFID